MTPAPKRRWLQFSLRGMLLIVAAVSLWLGYYVNWKNDRREARAWIDAHFIAHAGAGHIVLESPPDFPWMLKMLGEEPMPFILMAHRPSDGVSRPVPDEYYRLVARVRKLFPEAEVRDLSAPLSTPEPSP